MLPSLWENRRLVGQCMWGSHFWLFICYYSYLQANTYEELPEQVIGAARLAHVEPSTAVVPNLENNSESNKDNSSNDATSSEDDSSKKTNWFSLFLFWGIRWDFSVFYPFKLCYYSSQPLHQLAVRLISASAYIEFRTSDMLFHPFPLQLILILRFSLWMRFHMCRRQAS